MKTMSEISSMRWCFVSLLLLSCVLASSFTLSAGHAACRPDQIQTLMQFKNEFDSHGCNHKDYFNGVQCDNTTGAVTKLQLPSGCLTGILKPNSSLFKLHHLRYLNLTQNNFISSSLPFEFGKLNKLEVLSLSSNGFIGQVPSSISNLSLLNQLDLSFNKLTGSFPLVTNLSKLSILDLQSNNFSGTIPSTLVTMPFLSYLDLTRNHLTGSIEVPNSSSSSRLEQLYLGLNQFEGKIIEPISKLINLKYLNLSFLKLSYPIDFKIFSSLKSLLFLDLTSNSISPASLSTDSDIPMSLEALGLSDCDIKEFPNIFKNLENLTVVEVGENQIQGKVPQWLWKLPLLKFVDLSNNSFSGFEGSKQVLANSSLQVLNLQLNHFKGPFPIPPFSIIVLAASGNSFTGDLPFSICNRSFLSFLDLSYNNFTGPIPPCLSNVTVLNLRKNNLQGRIPDDFHSGALIRTFDVGYNQLTGKLPRSLVNCSSLQFLAVDHNRIKDTFPFWLKTLPNFQVFTLRSNNFYGPIAPPDQGPLGFPELRIFEISHNKFTGSLSPRYFENWKASRMKMNEDGSIYMGYSNKNVSINAYYWGDDALDLQYKGLNMEQGRVLTFYSTIDFSGNRLEGKIPESIGLLKGLTALNLSNNGFTGHIPLSLANVTALQSLDLSRNHLSGTIPSGLKALSFLAYMNVSHNQLKGEIPQGTQITGQSISSFEGNAGLCGLPLEESCFDRVSPIQQPKQEDGEDEEEVLNWKAAGIGYGSGILFGLAIAQVIASLKPKWFVKIIGT